MLLVPVDVRPSPIQGVGVFAREAIPAGTVVWQFDPGIDQRHPVSWLATQPEHVRRFVATHAILTLDKQHYALAGDHTVFINHSSDPNLTPRYEIVVNGEEVVVAARDIAAGEELTINYGDIDAGERDKLASGVPLFA
jgi:SET domain-containing protein